MDHFQGIIAEIFSNGQRLSLYDDTDSREVEESHARHQYVEAVAGSTFQVRVSLTPQFNFYKMKPEHAVAIHIKIDGNHGSSLKVQYTKNLLREKFSTRGLCVHTFTGPKHFSRDTRQWMRSDYSFGNLVLNMPYLLV